MTDFVARNTGVQKNPKKIKLHGLIIKTHSELYNCGTSHVCVTKHENRIRFCGWRASAWLKVISLHSSTYMIPTGWTVRGSNPGGGEIFRTRPDRPCGPSSLLYNGSFPGVKRSGRGAGHPPLLVPRSRKSRAIPLPHLCYGVPLLLPVKEYLSKENKSSSRRRKTSVEIIHVNST
jgi:hypothetical protein